MNECSHVGIYADKQEDISENKFANEHGNDLEDKQENKQSSNLPDTGLSSALGLLTPDINSNPEDEQIPMKKKKKKEPKRGFRR